MSSRFAIATALTAALGVAFATGCREPGMQGGTVVTHPELPRGVWRSSYRPAECRDGAGQPAVSAALFHLVETPQHVLIVIEERPGYDALVFEHPHANAGRLDYEVALEERDYTLRLQLSLPERLGPGTLHVSRELPGEPSPPGARPALSCTLEPIQGTGGEG